MQENGKRFNEQVEWVLKILICHATHWKLNMAGLILHKVIVLLFAIHMMDDMWQKDSCLDQDIVILLTLKLDILNMNYRMEGNDRNTTRHLIKQAVSSLGSNLNPKMGG